MVNRCTFSENSVIKCGLISAWSLDIHKKMMIPDLSGGYNDLKVHDAALAKGVKGYGIVFNGKSTYLTCDDMKTYGKWPAISISAWIKPDKACSTDDIAKCKDENSRKYTIMYSENLFEIYIENESLVFTIWNSNKPYTISTSIKTWDFKQWHHVVIIYDSGFARIYIDGKECGSASDFPHIMVGTELNLMIGSNKERSFYKGMIDEVSIYSGRLSEVESKSLYEEGLACIEAQKGKTIADIRDYSLQKGVFIQKPASKEMYTSKDGFLWIEAEDFTKYGGWLLDTQFIHLMGSPYLIAAGTGKPVEDAKVEIVIDKAGTYRVWARTKNWLKDYAPGRFKVRIGERLSEITLGASDKNDWTWEAAGDFELDAGRTELALHDITGCYSRCDALILTTDLDYIPPEKLDEIQAERRRLNIFKPEPQWGGEYDVIVVGAGPAGIPAALAAARQGAKTALIHDRPVMGGNASLELGIGFDGAANGHSNAMESGIVEELRQMEQRYYESAFQTAVDEEKNLTVFVNRRVIAADMKDASTIDTISAADTLTGTIFQYKAKMFIDCTGDGWLGFYAGAQYRLGREAKDEFNEDLAPEKADNATMSGCLMGGTLGFRAVDTGMPVVYSRPEWAQKFPDPQEFCRSISERFFSAPWWLEHSGYIDDLWEAEKARDELLRLTYGYWDYIKNIWPQKEKAENFKLEWVPIHNARRESRRLTGDYILKQSDAQNAVKFPDTIAYAGWPLDVHHPEGVMSGKKGAFQCNETVPINNIPFRCLYSINISNLLMAGRCISVTHVALGTVRVGGTCAATGQASGIAAAMCVKYGINPRDIYNSHINELQQILLKSDQYIPGIKNQDPDDIALKAVCTASGTGRYEIFSKENNGLENWYEERPRIKVPLNTMRAVMFPRGDNTNLDSVFLYLASKSEKPEEVTVYLREAQKNDDFSSAENIAASMCTIPPQEEGWFEFKMNAHIQSSFAWICILPAQDIFIFDMYRDEVPYSTYKAYCSNNKWICYEHSNYIHSFYIIPSIKIRTDFAPKNVVNGITRTIDDNSNMWATDPDGSLPQSIELDFGEIKEINTIHLTFDTNLNRLHNRGVSKRLVKDYSLSYYDGSEWRNIANIKENFLRKRVHKFDEVSAKKLRITVESVHGGRKMARIFEIRVYKE